MASDLEDFADSLLIEGRAYNDEDILAFQQRTQTAPISVVWRVAGLEVGDSFTVKNKSELPNTVNNTGKTRYASVYDDAVNPTLNNGRYWQEDGSNTWTKVSGDQSGRISSLESQMIQVRLITDPISETYSFYKMPASYRYHPVSGCVDAAGNWWLALDIQEGVMVAKFAIRDPMITQIINTRLSDFDMYKYAGTNDQVPLIATYDQSLLSISLERGEFVGNFPSQQKTYSAGENEPGGLLPTEFRILFAPLMQIIFYGQSNSVGFSTPEVLHSTQPYQNLTFDVGPKASPTGEPIGFNPGMLAFAPLTENTASAEGSSSQGETPCSACANYLTELDLIKSGSSSYTRNYFASAAGKGSTSIDGLGKLSSSQWYPKILVPHIQRPAILAGGGSAISVMGCVYVQGEADQDTDPTVWADKLELLRLDMQADFSAAHGTPRILHMIVPPVSRCGVNGGAVLGAWIACNKYPLIHLSRPFYGYESTDDIHLNLVSRNLLGIVAARDLNQIAEGRRPNWIRPISVTARGKRITVKCRVPTLPLRLDVSGLHPVKDMGFRVTDGIGDLIITPRSIVAYGDEIVFEVNRNLSGAATLRYALDYNSSASYWGGLSGAGNVCDSTPFTAEVTGKKYRLPYLMPAFKQSIFNFPQF